MLAVASVQGARSIPLQPDAVPLQDPANGSSSSKNANSGLDWCLRTLRFGPDDVRLDPAACDVLNRLFRVGGQPDENMPGNVDRSIDSLASRLYIVGWTTNGILEMAPFISFDSNANNHSDWAPTTREWLQQPPPVAAPSDVPRVAVLYASDDVMHLDWSALDTNASSYHCSVTVLAYTAPRRFLPTAVGVGSDGVGSGCVILVPTPYEILMREAYREEGTPNFWVGQWPQTPSPTPLLEREPAVFYRGTADLWGGSPQRDIAFQMGADPANIPWLNANASDPRTPSVAIRYRYQLDIGGISGTTWDALRGKFISGSLVFSVATGFADWWHARLAAGTHFIPVAADLADLHERFEAAERLLEAEPEALGRIISAAQQVVNETRFEGPLWWAYRERVLGALRDRPTCVESPTALSSARTGTTAMPRSLASRSALSEDAVPAERPQLFASGISRTAPAARSAESRYRKMLFR